VWLAYPRNESNVRLKKAVRLWLAQFHVDPRDGLEAELAAIGRGVGAVRTFERPYGGYAQ
jgi:hypothetical protein